MSTSVKKTEDKAKELATIDFSKDAGAGLENADADSFAIPFLTILQGQSPAVVEGIEGARAGLFMDTVSKRPVDVLDIIPCGFKRTFIRWGAKKDGGGYKGELSPAEIDGQEQIGDELLTREGMTTFIGAPKGAALFDGKGAPQFDILKDTRVHYVMFKNQDGRWMKAILSLTSTQIKKSKNWLAQTANLLMEDGNGNSFNPPTFSHSYRCATKLEENSSGQWHGLVVGEATPVSDMALYNEAKEFSQQAKTGAVKEAIPEEEVVAKGDGF